MKFQNKSLSVFLSVAFLLVGWSCQAFGQGQQINGHRGIQANTIDTTRINFLATLLNNPRSGITDSLGFTSGGVRIVVFSNGICVKESLSGGSTTVVDTVDMRSWSRSVFASRTDTTKWAANAKRAEIIRTSGATDSVYSKGDTVIFNGAKILCSANKTFRIFSNKSNTGGADTAVIIEGIQNLTGSNGITLLVQEPSGPSLICYQNGVVRMGANSSTGKVDFSPGGRILFYLGTIATIENTSAGGGMGITTQGLNPIVLGDSTTALTGRVIDGAVRLIMRSGKSISSDTILVKIDSTSTRHAAAHGAWHSTGTGISQDTIYDVWVRAGKIDTIQTDSLHGRRGIFTSGVNHADTAWYLVAPCPVDLWANAYEKNKSDTLLRLFDGPPGKAKLYAFIERGKPLQYTNPKLNLTGSASSSADLGPLQAWKDSVDHRLARTRRDLAKAIKKNQDYEALKNKYFKGVQ